MKKNFGQYSDKELFTALKQSKSQAEPAFAEIYSRYSGRIYAYCLKVLGNHEDAGDIFQEVMMKFYNSSLEKDLIENIPGYILKIARNLCLNFKRDRKITVDYETVVLSVDDNNYDKKELLDLIQSALDTLDFEYREAFILRQYQGLSYNEIAEVTGDTVTAIKNRVWRAKEKIKTILSPYLQDLEDFT